MKTEPTKHTPGPWELLPGVAEHEIKSQDGDYIAYVVGHSWGAISSEQGDANARLIAAAPDLLEELRAIERFNTPLPCGLLEQARAAIAKAEGAA